VRVEKRDAVADLAFLEGATASMGLTLGMLVDWCKHYINRAVEAEKELLDAAELIKRWVVDEDSDPPGCSCGLCNDTRQALAHIKEVLGT
jgi:hypothetical protein